MGEGCGGRGRAVGSLAIVALLVLSGCATTSGRPAARPSHRPAAAAPPGIFCGRAGLRSAGERYRPAQIGCLTADGSAFLGGSAPGAKRPGRLVWTRWTPRQADGHGYLWHNACQPSCATGQFFGQPVSVRALDPRNGWFTQLVIAFVSGPTSGPTTTAYTLDLKLAQWLVKAPGPAGGPSIPSA